ncbi:glutathione S-transferase family protein [Aureimonas glaciei]|uniref:Glutathione S-transferase n=1 Tax=Aureimonas glaciei TaxID=1776957 RepID=A0A916XU79_9HYPH|nr:glutathione S-transferase family protein [Aureimonas glaciei]GGD12344.1 glutathione S-transferase [Aureimonas glaciei]
MITLYHAAQSRSSRIVWLLEELAVPYEIVPVSIFRPMTGLGVPDAINPHPDKQVPAIVHDGALVAESVAIILYLTDALPQAQLGPRAGDPRRGSYLTWLAWYAAAMEPAIFAAMGGELEAAPMKRRSHEAVTRRLLRALEQGPYLMGDAFSGADILVGSALSFARGAFPESAVLDDYAARCKARPAAVRAAARDDAAGVQVPAREATIA